MILENKSNDWVFGGKIVYIKPMSTDTGYFGGTMMVEGQSKRSDSPEVRAARIICFLKQKDYLYLKDKGASKFDEIEVGGHFETWLDKRNNIKDMKIADSILNFQLAS